MKKTFFAIVFIFPALCIAQTQLVKQWDKTFGTPGFEQIYAVEQTVDGGFILGGISNSGISGDKSEPAKGNGDYWVVKIDSLGHKQWDKTFGGSGRNFLNSLAQCKDGGYILGGSVISPDGGDISPSGRDTLLNVFDYDYWVVKIDSHGNKQWDRRLGGTGTDYLKRVIATSDGGYVISGSSRSDSSWEKSQQGWGAGDLWIVKLDAQGTKLWDKDFGGTNQDLVGDVRETQDGGYIVTSLFSSGGGTHTLPARGWTDYGVIKISSAGNLVWDRRFGSDDFDFLTSMDVTADNGFIFCGYTSRGVSFDKTEPSKGMQDYWVVKGDSLGNKQWDRSLGGAGMDLPACVRQDSDGGYIVGGNSNSEESGDKSESIGINNGPWVIKLDAQGNRLWDKTAFCRGYSGGYKSYYEELDHMRPTRDGGYIVAATASGIGGYKTQAGHDTTGGKDFWIVKFGPAIDPAAPTVSDFMLYDSLVCGLCINSIVNTSQNATSFQWFFPGAQITSSTDYTPRNICYNAEGTYTVKLIASGNGRVDSITRQVFIRSIPVVNLGSDTTVCGRQFLLNAGNAGCTYLWSDSSASQTLIAAPVNLGFSTYWVKVSNEWCVTRDTVKVNFLGSALIDLGPDTSFCGPGAVTIRSRYSYGAGLVFVWQDGTTAQAYIVTNTGNYSLSITDYNHCTTTDSKFVTVFSPVAHYTLIKDTVLPHNWFAINQSAGNEPLSYTWYWGDGTSSTGATPSHIYSAAGLYNICLTIEDSAGCINTYCDSSTYIYKTEQDMVTVNVVYELPTAITENKSSVYLTISPNPANGYFTLKTTNELVGSNFIISDVTGKEVSSIQLPAEQYVFNASNLANGVYFASIKKGTQVITRKLVIQK